MARLPRRLIVAALLFSTGMTPMHADGGARFDLTGPKIDVRITRNGESLPIDSVPNLRPGDKIWLHPDLPPTQSVHYLLIAVFLRGTTNPPPDEWFTRIETWNKKVRAEGVTVTVPDEAQQAVLFLAPETGGDFGTLKSAVRGRPGVFVRASQDLNAAAFEQARIDAYLTALKQLASADQADLQNHSNLLARTLALKPNPDCFKLSVDQQYNCLTQTGTQTLLDDGHGQSVVDALTGNAGGNLITTASTTQLAGGGNYSAYVGTIVDFVHIMSGLHTAQYQYIPAIASPSGEALNLRLNTPPSFHNPKSVLVIALPAIQNAQLPPLRAADPNHISCLLQPKMVLPVEGAPLVFSTAFAHNLVLHIDTPGGKDLPLTPDAFQGGLAVTTVDKNERHELPEEVPGIGIPKSSRPAPTPAVPGGALVTGTVRGMWGFDSFTGPTLPLQQLPGGDWKIVATQQTPSVLIAGQPNHLQLMSSGTACIKSISVEPGDLHADWKLASHPADPAQPVKPGSNPIPPVEPVDLTLNLQHAATPGNLQLAVTQYGETKPDEIGAKTFSEPAKIKSVSFHAGDTSATLDGSSLDQVSQLKLNDYTFKPVPENAMDQAVAAKTPNRLSVSLPYGDKPPIFKVGEQLTAVVALRDGRELNVPVTVESARPEVSILSRRIVSSGTSLIKLAGVDDLPLGSQLVFFLKSQGKFPRNEQIEIANADESLHTDLTISSGTLVMQDAHTIFATLDPLKTFGNSVYGPLRLRAVAADGTDGNWLPLATIVRLPTLDQVQCASSDSTQPCILSGSNLYLLAAVAADPSFDQASNVPDGYVDPTFNVPHPAPGGVLYLRLRDDPGTVQEATLPIATPPEAPKHASAKNSPKPVLRPALPTVEPPAAHPETPPATPSATSPPASPAPPPAPNPKS